MNPELSAKFYSNVDRACRIAGLCDCRLRGFVPTAFLRQIIQFQPLAFGSFLCLNRPLPRLNHSSDTTPTLQIHNGDLFSPSFQPFLPLFWSPAAFVRYKSLWTCCNNFAPLKMNLFEVSYKPNGPLSNSPTRAPPTETHK